MKTLTKSRAIIFHASLVNAKAEKFIWTGVSNCVFSVVGKNLFKVFTWHFILWFVFVNYLLKCLWLFQIEWYKYLKWRQGKIRCLFISLYFNNSDTWLFLPSSKLIWECQNLSFDFPWTHMDFKVPHSENDLKLMKYALFILATGFLSQLPNGSTSQKQTPVNLY